MCRTFFKITLKSYLFLCVGPRNVDLFLLFFNVLSVLTIWIWFISLKNMLQLECGPMPNVMVALPNIGGALCSTPQSLADAHY